MKYTLLAFFLFSVFYVFGAMADEAQTDRVLKLDEITVTGTRGEKGTFESSRAVSIATGEEIAERSVINAADILAEEAGVQVQKTTYGQGSPIIRGLTGYHGKLVKDVHLMYNTYSGISSGYRVLSKAT